MLIEHIKLKRLIALSLSFFSLCTLAQPEYAFKLDSLCIFEVSDLGLAMGDLSKIGAGSGKLLWPCRDKSRQSFILEFDCNACDFRRVDVPKNKCLDRDFTIRGVTGMNSSYFVWSNSGLIFNGDDRTVKCVDDPDITSGLFRQNGHLTFSNYYREEAESARVRLFSKGKPTQVEIDPHHFELTRFNPNNLMTSSSNHIARVSVSRPILYVYNHDFELLDSVVYNTENWINIDSNFGHEELQRLKKENDDFFSYYFTLFERGLSKNMNLQFLSDSLLLVGYISGTGNNFYQVISVDESGQIGHISQSQRVGKGQCFQEGVEVLDSDNFEPNDLVTNGVAVDGSLYYVVFGSPSFPWGETCEFYEELQNQPNPDRLKWLHIFKYKLVEK